MANLKISDLAAAAALTDNDLVELEQPGEAAGTRSRKVTLAAIKAYVAAGGGGGGGVSLGLQYIAETGSSSDTDPGAGTMKWNNATQSSATFLFLNDATADAGSMTGLWAALDAGGFVYLQDAANQDIWQIFEITGVTDAAGYVKFAVVYLAGNGSFSDGAAMLVTIEQGGGAGALTNFAETRNSSTPNTSTPAHQITPSAVETNIDFVMRPKGSGALLANTPDNATTGGNKRGAWAVDLQLSRSAAAQVASGQYAFIGGGERNTVSADYSACLAGYLNTISASYCMGGGQANTISGQYSFGFGNNCTADAIYTWVTGFNAQARAMIGAAARSNGNNQNNADAQWREALLRQTTSDATATRLTSNKGAASSTNQFILPNNSAFYLTGSVVVREDSTGDCASFEIKVLIRRGANAASTAVVGTPTATQVFATAGAATWAIALTADTTNGGLAVTATGEAAHSLKWVADLHSTECVG